MKKNKKVIYAEDDGHTIYNMDVDGLPNRVRKDNLALNKKEKKALISAAYEKYLPVMFICILGFAIAMLVILLWLR